jgi:hypothetical protein
MPIKAVYQVGIGSAELTLGDHQISEQLRRLEISKTAFVGKNYLSKYLVLPSGDSMGKTEKTYQGYEGQDVSLGRLTIKYENSQEPIDLNMAYGRAKPIA